jgi:BirA family biotin operon repressor/biotin-[acetyl-CoA-carboxylase] ligase
MDQHTLESELAALPLGGLRYFDRVGSTNDIAAEWAEAGAPDFALALADQQTAGRGRGNRAWFTAPGAALAFSLILRPGAEEINAAASGNMARFTGLGALALCDVLQHLYSLPAQIKWPNDVLIAGQKIAGILVETHWLGERPEAIILGIGVNVAPSAVPPSELLDFPASCIEAHWGSPVERIPLLRAVLSRLLAWRTRLATAEFIQAWEAALAFRDREIAIISPTPADTPPLCGQIVGLSPDGTLRLLTASGEVVCIQAGEIRLRPVDRARK